MPDAVILKRSSGHHKAAVDKSIFHALACDFLALGQLISLIDKAVVCRYDKVMGVSAAIDAADQIHDLLHGFLTGVEHLILGVGLVATGIDLVVVHIDDLPLGEDIPQVCHLHALDLVKLDTDTVRHIALQHLLTPCQRIAEGAIHQNLKVIGHFQRAVREKRSHAQPGIGGQHAQLHVQLRRALGVILHPGKKLLPYLIPHSIGDDDHGALLGVAQVGVVEIPLQGQHRQGILLPEPLIPCWEKGVKVFVGVDVLHQFPQRLKGFGVFQLVVIEVELPVLLVYLMICGQIPVHNGFEALGAAVVCRLHHAVGTLQQLVGLVGLSAKVHLGTLFAHLRDGQLVELRPGILGKEPPHQPLDQHLIHRKEGIALHQIIGTAAGERLIDVQPLCHMIRKFIVLIPVENAVHQAVEEGNDVACLVGHKGLPRRRQLRLHIAGGIGDEKGHQQPFQRGFYVRIAKMLLAQPPEGRQQIVLFKLLQVDILRKTTLGEHDTHHLFKGAGACFADGAEQSGEDIFLVKVLDLQIVEPLGALFIGKELDVLFEDGLVLFLNAKVYRQQ